MTLKVTHGHQKWRHSVGHTSLPYVLCSNNVYRPIAPFSRPVTYGMPSFSKYIRFLFPQYHSVRSKKVRSKIYDD